MVYNLLFFDIETVPDSLDDDLMIPCKLGKLTDPKKIAAKEAEWGTGGQIKAHSVSPYHNKIVALEMYTQDQYGNQFIEGLKDSVSAEKNLLDDFHSRIQQVDYIIGFNILNFDLPSIMFRSAMLGVKSTPISLRRYSTKPVVDLMEILAGWNPQNRKSLNWFLKRFGIGEKSGDGGQVYDMYKAGKMDEIREYCRKDVELTKELFYRVAEVYLPGILLF